MSNSFSLASSSSSSSSATTTKDSLIKELNANYKSYLEHSLLYKLLFSMASAPPATKGHEDLVEARLKEAFWKSHINNLDQEFKMEPLESAAKEYITTHIEHVLEKQLAEIDQFVRSGEDHAKTDSADLVLARLRELLDAVRQAELNSSKLTEDINLKLEHCVNLTSEIADLLKHILSDFKLDFYVQENKLNCETQLLTCESVLAKMDKVLAELKAELYSPDKLRSLKLVRAQLNAELTQNKSKSDQLTQMLSLYKSLGEDFEAVLSKYKDLKSQLEYKKWTLAKLNEDLHL